MRGGGVVRWNKLEEERCSTAETDSNNGSKNVTNIDRNNN